MAEHTVGQVFNAMGRQHSCADSKLACIDCGNKICPSCMVQCAVGNRCGSCAGRFTSHMEQVSLALMIRTAIGGLFVGYAFGYVQQILSDNSYGWYLWIAVYLVGAFAGALMHKLAGYKLCAKVTTISLLSVIAGIALSPLHSLFVDWLGSLAGGAEAGSASVVVATMISCAIFLCGILRPFQMFRIKR